MATATVDDARTQVEEMLDQGAKPEDVEAYLRGRTDLDPGERDTLRLVALLRPGRRAILKLVLVPAG